MSVQSIKHTRGGLVPARITNLSNPQDVVHCMFNPYEYTLSKQNTWETQNVRGRNAPKGMFAQGGKVTLKLTLYFDGLLEGRDVRDHTDALWRMMLIDEKKVHSSSGKGTPPEVAFEWGRMYFKAVLTSMTQKFTLFKEDGTPVRCQVDVTLEQFSEVAAKEEEQRAGRGANGSTSEVTATAGDRMDHIAANNGAGDPSSYRRIAESNNIDNPQNIPAGQRLTVNKN